MKNFFEESAIGHAANAALDFVNAPSGPSVNGGIYIAKGPLVSGQLAVGIHIPFAQEEHELILGEVRVDNGQRDAVKGQIPRRVPGVFPFVGHRNDVVVIKLRPILISSVPAFLGWSRLSRVAGEPGKYVIMVELFGPHHSRQGLSHYRASIFGNILGHTRSVEIVGFFLAQIDKTIETGTEIVRAVNLFVEFSMCWRRYAAGFSGNTVRPEWVHIGEAQL